jgi:germination protein M
MGKMNQKKLVLLGLLFVLLVVLIIIFLTSGRAGREPTPSVPSEAEALPAESGETRTVVLFFPSEDDGFLHPEEREIRTDISVVDQAKQVIRELLRGSQSGYLSPLPEGTQLRELYITQDGVACVDFSRDIQEKHLSGSSAEISTVYSLVNSLTQNFEPITKVFILIDGRERQTLGGHIDLSRPFSPKQDLISR